jgi:mannose-6-phosphate isomerase-like protein (cupin superfamily)
MHVITASEAPRFELPGVEFTGYAAPSRGSAELCAWQITVAPALVSEMPHTIDRDEVFLVTSGRIRLTEDGLVLVAGDCAVVPAGEQIRLVNPDAEPATAYVAIRAGFTAKAADGTAIGTPPWAA